MDASRLLLTIFVVAESHSEAPGSAEHKCINYDVETVLLPEGEAFYFVPYIFKYIKLSSPENITWYKEASKVKYVSRDEKARIHHDGAALFLLDLVPEDSGEYVARHVDSSGQCSNSYLTVIVFKSSHRNNSDYICGKIQNSDVNKKISCPLHVEKTCDDLKGNFTWYKDFTLIKGEHEKILRVKAATKRDEGVYTCVCSWTRNDTVHMSSASRFLEVDDSRCESERERVNILPPTNKEQVCEDVRTSSRQRAAMLSRDSNATHVCHVSAGAEVTLNCSVLCCVNTDNCKAQWFINDKPINPMDGYKQTTDFRSKDGNTIASAFLTFAKVSEEHFLSEFKCKCENLFSLDSIIVILENRGSILPVLVGNLSLLCVCVFAVVLFKCFIIDLTLFIRSCVPASAYKHDARTYDAYVVYQTQSLDTATEDTLGRFVMNTLPSVLEEKFGYRLYIQGRDDLPGQDYMELVEERMKASRRLMIILRLGSASQPRVNEKMASLQKSVGGFDWQVGFHHALMQAGVKVILIQLGAPGPQRYADLPLSLQHLIRKNPPVTWPEGPGSAAAPSSRFWKRVRYLMPAVPVGQLPAVQGLRMDEEVKDVWIHPPASLTG